MGSDELSRIGPGETPRLPLLLADDEPIHRLLEPLQSKPDSMLSSWLPLNTL